MTTRRSSLCDQPLPPFAATLTNARAEKAVQIPEN